MAGQLKKGVIGLRRQKVEMAGKLAVLEAEKKQIIKDAEAEIDRVNKKGDREYEEDAAKITSLQKELEEKEQKIEELREENAKVNVVYLNEEAGKESEENGRLREEIKELKEKLAQLENSEDEEDKLDTLSVNGSTSDSSESE